MTLNGIRDNGSIIVKCLLVFAVATGARIALAEGQPGKGFVTFRQEELGDLERRFAEAQADAAVADSMKAAKGTAEIADAVVADVVTCYEQVRAAAVGSLVGEAILSRKQPKVATSHSEQVRDLYVKYQDRLAKANSTPASAPQAQIATEYSEAVLAAAEKYVFLRGGELAAMGIAGPVPAEYGVLMPLLCHADVTWSKDLVNGFPDWMRTVQSLKAAEQVCLRSGRPKAAYYLWVRQVSASETEGLDVGSYIAYLHRRANACFGSKEFLNGIAILKAAIQLADQEGMADAAVESRFRLAEVYAMYGHSQLAAEEMKLILTTYPQQKDYGRAALTRLKYLYESNVFDRITEEAPALLQDKSAENYHPQILYIAWVASRRQDKQAQAKSLQEQLIRDYPSHPLCADVHFSSAMSLLAAGDYAGATRVLDMITERYPQTTVAGKAREIRTRIEAGAKVNATTSEPGKP